MILWIAMFVLTCSISATAIEHACYSLEVSTPHTSSCSVVGVDSY